MAAGKACYRRKRLRYFILVVRHSAFAFTFAFAVAAHVFPFARRAGSYRFRLDWLSNGPQLETGIPLPVPHRARVATSAVGNAQSQVGRLSFLGSRHKQVEMAQFRLSIVTYGANGTDFVAYASESNTAAF